MPGKDKAQADGRRRIEYVPLGGVERADRNAKAHDIAWIKSLVGRFGFVGAAVHDGRTGKIVAGHGRLESLQEMAAEGQSPPDGIVAGDGGAWAMPVEFGWSSRSDAEAEALAVALNEATTRGGWDDAALAEILRGLDAADADLRRLAGWDDAGFGALVESLGLAGEPGGGADSGGGDPDEAPEPPAEPVTRPGDLWYLGPHRLYCGDATDPEALARLTDGAGPGIVYTDPPYGIAIVKSNGKIGSGGKFRGKIGSGKIVPTTEYLPVAGDDNTDVATEAFRLLYSTHPDARHVWWGGNHYAASVGLPDASCWLVWDKDNGTNDFADCELAWTNHPGAVRLFRHMWNGMLRASERGPRVHPTQKPVALAEWAFGVVDPKGERAVVLDTFAGSGSTLVAAHRTRRVALLAELELAYADVICQRWQESTGELPVLASTGERHDFATVPADPDPDSEAR